MFFRVLRSLYGTTKVLIFKQIPLIQYVCRWPYDCNSSSRPIQELFCGRFPLKMAFGLHLPRIIIIKSRKSPSSSSHRDKTFICGIDIFLQFFYFGNEKTRVGFENVLFFLSGTFIPGAKKDDHYLWSNV